MAFLIAGDIARIRAYCLQGNQLGLNVLHYVASLPTGSGVTEAEVAGAFNTTTASKYADCLNAQAEYRGASVQNITSVPSSANGYDPVTSVGTVTGDPLPGAVSGIIGLKTAKAGRKYRGRVYIPFPGEADNTVAGVPSGGYNGRLNSLAAAIKGFTVTGVGGTMKFDLVVYHRATHTWDNVTTTISRARWATQRRRSDFGAQDTLPDELR